MVGVERMNRRAILLTVGAVLIASAIVGYAALASSQQSDVGALAAQLAGYERTAETFDSIAQGFVEIFNATSGITIETTNQTIRFTETLPNTDSGTFSSAVSEWESFLESNESAITLSTGALTSTLTVNLQPHNINYSHDSFGGNQLIVSPATLTGNRYDVNITTSHIIVSCLETITSGSFELNVIVDGSLGDCTKNLLVDPSANNRVQITIIDPADPLGLATVKGFDIDLNATKLFVTRLNATTATFDTRLWYNASGLERREARLLPETLINVAFPRLGITRTGTAIINTW